MYFRPPDKTESQIRVERDLLDSEESYKGWKAVRVKMILMTWLSDELAAVKDPVQ